MTEYLQPIITIVSSGTILLILREQIKSQQSQIDSMKSTMDSMKKYTEIFNVDEVEKYVSMVGKTKTQEAELKAINRVHTKIIPDLVNSSHKHLTDQVKELFTNTCNFLFDNHSEQQINELIDKRYKYTGQMIRNAYQYRKDHPQQTEQKMS
jgi:hypothetical protein